MFVALIPYAIVFTIDCVGWRFTFGPTALKGIPFRVVWSIRLIGEAINNVIPSMYVGGEAVKVGLLKRRGVPVAGADRLSLSSHIAFEDLQDPYGIEFWPEFKGRDGCRTPMVWQAQAEHGGFSDAKPWLPVKPEQASRAVDRQEGDPSSVLAYYREILAYRKGSDALMTGETTFADLPEPVLGFARGEGDDGLLCLFNLSNAPQTLTLGEKATPEPVSRNYEMAGEILKLGANGFVLIKGLSADGVRAE